MKSYDELKAEMEAIQQKIVEAKNNERANALKEVKRLRKEFRAPSKINASILVGNSLRYAALARKIEAFILLGTLSFIAGVLKSSHVEGRKKK